MSAPSSTNGAAEGQVASGATVVRVTLRPIGSALPLGMFAPMPAGLLLAGLQLGWFPVSDAKTVAYLLLGFAVPLQFVSSLFAFLGRDSLVGTSFGIFTDHSHRLSKVHSLGPLRADQLHRRRARRRYRRTRVRRRCVLRRLRDFGGQRPALRASHRAPRSRSDLIYRRSRHTAQRARTRGRCPRTAVKARRTKWADLTPVEALTVIRTVRYFVVGP